MQAKIPKKIALVTGAATSIGRDIAISLAKNGWYVAIHYNNSEMQAKELSKYINDITNSIYIQADLNNVNNIEKILIEIEQKFGKANLLINNAAHFENDSANNLNISLLNKHMQINCLSPVMLSAAFIKSNTEDRLNIINILDYTVVNATKNFFSYNLSKSALLNATKQMALQLAPRCRVNAISPGNVCKDSKQSENHFHWLVNNSPLATVTTTQEICEAIDFIIKTKSMTGVNLLLDSGSHLER